MLQIKIQGASRLRTLGSRVQASLKASLSLAPVRNDIARITADSNRRSFQNERGPRGEDWPRRATPKGKRKVLTHRLLDLTGKLKTSLLAPKTQISNFGRDLRITYEGEHAFLAAVHTKGSAKRGLPSRPVGNALDRQAVEEINKIAFQKIAAEFSKRLKSG